MKTNWLAIVTALNLLFGFAAKADLGTTSGDGQGGSGSRKSALSEKSSDQGGDSQVKPELPEKPVRPETPDNSGKSDLMKQLVSDFQTKAAVLRAQRLDLNKQLKDATEEERAKLREQLQANRDAVAKLKEQFRDDVKELHDSLKNHGDKVDAELKAEAKAAAKGGRTRD